MCGSHPKTLSHDLNNCQCTHSLLLILCLLLYCFWWCCALHCEVFTHFHYLCIQLLWVNLVSPWVMLTEQICCWGIDLVSNAAYFPPFSQEITTCSYLWKPYLAITSYIKTMRRNPATKLLSRLFTWIIYIGFLYLINWIIFAHYTD